MVMNASGAMSLGGPIAGQSIALEFQDPYVYSYSSPGTYTFTVPTGITSMTIYMMGGGGGSGGNYQNGTTVYSGGSGTTGTLITGVLTVVPGTTYTIVVGAGGAAGARSWNSGTGGTAGTGHTAGTAGTTNTNGGGGGGGGSTAIVLTSTNTSILVAKGGNGGNAAVGISGAGTYAGAGGAGGGSNLTATGMSIDSTAYNGGTGGSLTQIFSNTMTYSSCWSTVGSYIIPPGTYSAAFSGAFNYGTSKDQRTDGTINPGYTLYAGDTGLWTSGALITFYTGGSVSGINTSHNGYTNYYLFSGDTANAGSNGYVLISVNQDPLNPANPVAQISFNDSIVRKLAKKPIDSSAISMPTDFYSKYYRALTASTDTYYLYNIVSGQGGYANGGYNYAQPSGEADICDGWRSGDLYYPTGRNSSDSYNGWVTFLESNNFTSLSNLYTALTTTYNLAFSNVTWVSNSGTTQSFTATLNSGYHIWLSGGNAVSGAGGVVGFTPCYMNSGTTLTFYVDATTNGIGVGTGNRGTGRTRMSIYKNQGMLWTNTTKVPGVVNAIYSVTGSGKLGNIRVLVDGIVINTANNGDTGCGSKSYSGTFSNLAVNANSSVLLQTYWWGCGNFQWGVNYISGGSWKIGSTLSIV